MIVEHKHIGPCPKEVYQTISINVEKTAKAKLYIFQFKNYTFDVFIIQET